MTHGLEIWVHIAMLLGLTEGSDTTVKKSVEGMLLTTGQPGNREKQRRKQRYIPRRDPLPSSKQHIELNIHHNGQIHWWRWHYESANTSNALPPEDHCQLQTFGAILCLDSSVKSARPRYIIKCQKKNYTFFFLLDKDHFSSLPHISSWTVIF